MKWRPASFSSGLELKLTPPLPSRSFLLVSLPTKKTVTFFSSRFPLVERATFATRCPAGQPPLIFYALLDERLRSGRKLVKPLSSIPFPPFWSTAGLPILSYFGTNIMLISHRAPAVSRDTRGCKGSPRSCVATLWIISKAGCARVKKLLNDYHWRLNGSFFFFLFFQTWMANEVLDLGAVFIRGLKLLYSNFLV